SLVPLAADLGAGIRGARMEDEKDPTDDAQERATVNKEIRQLAAAAGIDHRVADSLIDRQATVEQARAALFDELQRRTATVQHQRVDIGENHDAAEQKIERMADALESRMTGAAPSDAGRPYMHKRLVDLAAELLESRGVPGVRMMSPDSVLKRAGEHVTSDF